LFISVSCFVGSVSSSAALPKLSRRGPLSASPSSKSSSAGDDAASVVVSSSPDERGVDAPDVPLRRVLCVLACEQRAGRAGLEHDATAQVEHLVELPDVRDRVRDEDTCLRRTR
jgi:hypothetical protein